jgi:hypothetical protein
MLHPLATLPKDNPDAATASRIRRIKTLPTFAALAMSLLLLGCGPRELPKPEPAKPVATQTPRPTIPPPPFRVFHHTDTSITLVTKETATDDEISAIIWQLRNAAHTHTLTTLKIDQKMVDARKPSIFFHIYRGQKCAAEKYAAGAPPCGGSYHAAGDYTFGTYGNPNWDDGLLLHDEHENPLWNPDSPYTAPTPNP